MQVKCNLDKTWGLPRKKPQRYDVIPEIVREINAKVLLEIGVYIGLRAEWMIQAALETPGRVSYYGLDLFEDFTEEIAQSEASPRPPRMAEVYHKIKGFGVDVQLFKGFSSDTLPLFVKMDIKPDFVFIDGGHSFETVEQDWENVKKVMRNDTIVVFDDYLLESEFLKWGCNRVIDSLGPDYKWELLGEPDSYSMKQTNSNLRKESKTWLVKVWKNTV